MSSSIRQRVIDALLMSGLMSLLMTGWVTWINIGLEPDFLVRWAHAFVLAWPAAFIILLATGPAVLRLSQRFAGVSVSSSHGPDMRVARRCERSGA